MDQATNICGYCLMNSEDYAIIKTGSIHLQGNNVQERIAKLKQTVNLIIENYRPDYFVLEDVQYQNNPKTHKILSELLGVLENYYYENTKNYLVVSVNTWRSGFLNIKEKNRTKAKQATIEYIKKEYDLEVDNDAADAIGLARYGCYFLNQS